MAPPPKLRFSHLGIHVHDMEKMVQFYTKLLGMQVTDRGRLPLPGNPEIVFLSRDPDEHHQIALVEGRKDGGIERGVINQISFCLETLSELRKLKTAAEKAGVTEFLPLSHGNAWSLYFPDPEGNAIECFVRSPWHVRQPVADAFDLSRSDEEILATTEARYKNAPDFQPRESWKKAFAKRLGATD